MSNQYLFDFRYPKIGLEKTYVLLLVLACIAMHLQRENIRSNLPCNYVDLKNDKNFFHLHQIFVYKKKIINNEFVRNMLKKHRSPGCLHWHMNIFKSFIINRLLLWKNAEFKYNAECNLNAVRYFFVLCFDTEAKQKIYELHLGKSSKFICSLGTIPISCWFVLKFLLSLRSSSPSYPRSMFNVHSHSHHGADSKDSKRNKMLGRMLWALVFDVNE